MDISTKQSFTIKQAFNYCEKIVLGHYENFPVGSILIPSAQRPHVYSVYAFARLADDFADEGNIPPTERLDNLSSWRKQLNNCIEGKTEHPVFVALAETIKLNNLPLNLFHDLLDAFELDVKRSRHKTFQDLLDYSRRSANPVGRLILLLFGYQDEKLHILSDSICTGLQLTNFWQDILIDLSKDRIYIPKDEMENFEYSENDLRELKYSTQYIKLMESLAKKTEALFYQGKPLCSIIGGRLGFELRLTWHGGISILNKLKHIQFNVFNKRPTIQTSQKFEIFLKSLWPN